MSLEIYRRGRKWWIRGRTDGIDGYINRSLGTSDEDVAKAKAREIERKARQRALLGDDAPKPEDELTFAAAVLLYPAKPAEAGFLLKVVPEIGDMRVRDILPKIVRDLGRKIYPHAATDTWRRQVVTPVCAVINNAHQLGKCQPIRVKAYTTQERLEQDRRRGKTSRQDKTPGNWEWLHAFRQHATTPYVRALALFLFTTGARITQATQIRPRDLDLQNGRLLLPAAKGHEAQWVHLIPELVVELANLPARNGRVFGYAGRDGATKAFRATCEAAGIEYIAPHAAGRHGFATELLTRRGVDVATVKKMGRWSSAKVLLDTYVHEDEDGPTVRDVFQSGFHENIAKPVQPGMQKRRKRLK